MILLYISQPPLPSTRPPVLGYKVSYNITGSVMVNLTSDNNFTIGGVTPGVYLFTVLAFNILGDGSESSITVVG